MSRNCGLTIGCRGCGALHAFGREESVARQPRTPDPCVVRPAFTPLRMTRRIRFGTSLPDAHCRPAVADSAVLEDVVASYIRDFRPGADRELDFFRRCTSLKRAVKYAGLSMLPSGKRHPHQYRIPLSVLRKAERNLQAVSASLRGCATFDELFQLVQSEIGGIYGVGELTVYDVTTRLGAFLGLEPERVYLHAGTREGARHLGITTRRESFESSELPRAFRKLRPREIEDCLCIYKRQLAKRARA
jgi:hypothetical protein